MSATTGSNRILPFVPRGHLTFGIYPGGAMESPDELANGKPDLPDEVNRALDSLQSGRNFVVRTYLRHTGSDKSASPKMLPSISRLAQYTWNGRKLDLVLSNWDRTGNMADWIGFIERSVERYGEYLQNVQICEEPNLFEYPGDGRFGHSVDAVLLGVRAARAVVRKRGLRVAVGFNAVPSSFHQDGFWQGLKARVDRSFLDALDYVGLNMYIDVGEPLVGTVEEAVAHTLQEFRNDCLAAAGIPGTIPIHVCENGWPTGPNRFYTRQADILRSIIKTIHDLRNTLNINQFELFSLRDADTGNPEIQRQFGIMRDDYTPKPAFEVYRRLIQEFGD